MKSEEFDRAFDDGEDVTASLDISAARKRGALGSTVSPSLRSGSPSAWSGAFRLRNSGWVPGSCSPPQTAAARKCRQGMSPGCRSL